LPETRIDQQYFGDMRAINPGMLEGMDAVVHLAAISNDPMGNSFEKVTKDINDESSANLAGHAKEAGVTRFVFASSCSMYGFAEGGPRKEDDTLNPLTAYARSKVATEQTLQELATKDFVVTSLRFATACGMSERLRLDLVLNDFVAGAVAARQITILSDGTPWRPLIHIEDMARAIEWAIGRELSNGGAFLAVNTGSNEWNYQVKDLAHAVAKVIPDVSVSINKNAQPDKRSYQVDFSLFRRLAPVHQPKVDLIGAIQGLKEGLEKMGFADGNFRNSQFMRLKVLTHFRDIGLLDEQLRWASTTPVEAVFRKAGVSDNR
jgi:nucleoside-diphosphate-sugar epimerase